MRIKENTKGRVSFLKIEDAHEKINSSDTRFKREKARSLFPDVPASLILLE